MKITLKWTSKYSSLGRTTMNTVDISYNNTILTDPIPNIQLIMGRGLPIGGN